MEGWRTQGQFEDHTQVFIVRIWREPRENPTLPVELRGVIEHVPSGERRYFKHLDDIVMFITPYLGQLGVEAGNFQRFKSWIQRNLCN